MSATFRERPSSFDEAIRLALSLLSRNSEIVAQGRLQAEAELIVSAAHRQATGKLLRRSELYSRAADRYPDAAGDFLIEFAVARSEGRLLQHLFGTQYFGEHEYRVSPAVLIPRPETEVLLDQAEVALDSLRTEGGPRLGLEIGLGSGILSIELLSRYPGLRMIASETSNAAVAVARENAITILGEGGAARLEIVQVQPGDVCGSLKKAIELEPRRPEFLISNPPYLKDVSEASMEVVTHEPHAALFAPEGDPLFFYREIASGAEELIAEDGALFLEIAHERARETAELFESRGWATRVIQDLTGRNRVLIAVLRRTLEG